MATTRQVKAGSAFVEFFLDDGRLQRGLKRTEGRMRKFGQRLTSIGTRAFTAGVAGLAAFAFPVKKLAEFDDAMRATKAVTNATGEEFQRLTKTAKELGRTTSFTAVQVANLMTELGRAGFSPAQIDNMTQSVLNLSRATGTEASQAAGIMAATIRQFQLEAKDGARVADVLTVAANSTFNTVEQLGESLKFAGPVANDLNMSLEETVAMLGALGNVGIQGSLAGTSLRRLATITGAEAEKLENIFGVSFTDAAGDVRPLADAMGDVARATNNLPTAERMQMFNEAFGLLGITGASAIGKSAVAVDELTAKLENLNGQAAKTAEDMDKGTGGTLRRLQSAWEGLQLAVGKSIEQMSGSLGESLTETIGKVTRWIELNPGLVQTLAKLTIGLAAGGAALVAFGGSIQLVAFGIGGLSTALGVATKAVGLFKIGAIATGNAITRTIVPNLIAYTSTVGAAKLATLALKGGLVTLAVAGIAFLAKKIFDLNPAIRAFNDEMERAGNLDKKLNNRFAGKRQATLEQAASIEDPKKRAEFLQAQVQRAQAELGGAKNQVEFQRQEVARNNTILKSLTGNKVLAAEQKALKNKQERVKTLKEFISALSEEKAIAEREARLTKEKREEQKQKVQQQKQAKKKELQGLLPGLALFPATAGGGEITDQPSAPVDVRNFESGFEASQQLAGALAGGFAGMTTLLSQDEGLQRQFAETSDTMQRGSQRGANTAARVQSRQTQEKIAQAISRVKSPEENVTNAVDKMNGNIGGKLDKQIQLAKNAPKLAAAKT